MSATLLRLGLWTLVLILALYVIKETYRTSAIAEFVPDAMLSQALMVSVVLIVAGVIVKMFEKTKTAVARTRCKVCGKTVASGAIYCREHLRSVLELEDRRTHSTRLR